MNLFHSYKLPFGSLLALAFGFPIVLSGQDFANEIIQKKQEQEAAAQENAAGLSGGLQEPAGDITGTSPPDNAAADREKAIDAIATEIDELIPGKYARNSPQRNLLVDIATKFVNGDAQGVNAGMQELEKTEPNLPPKGLLYAGMNYAVNRERPGRQILEQTALRNPDHPSIPIAFCRLALSQGRLLDAQALMEMAQRVVANSKLDPAVVDYYRRQLMDAQVTVTMGQGRFEDALKYVTEWEKVDPQNTKMLINRAEIEFQKGNIDTSQQYITRFRALTPNSRPTELILAKWFQQKGNVAGTEEWVKKAAEKYPDNSLVQLELGNWAVSQEDFVTATQAVQKIEEKDGESPATKLIKGRIAFAKGAYGVAEAHFDALYQRQPNSFDVSNMYALCLIESRDSAKNMRARQIAQRNIQGLPNSQVAQAAFGWVLLKTGNLGDAKQVLGRVVAMPRMPPEIAYFLAVMFHQDGDSENAKKLLEPAVAQKGMFLYRNKAKELLAEINGTSGLPDPGN